MLKRWNFRRRKLDLEDELREARPVPPPHLVTAIRARLDRRPGPAPTRLRLGRAMLVATAFAAVLVGSSMAAGLGLTGGLQLPPINHPLRAFSSPGPSSAASEYVSAPTVTGFSPSSGLPGSSVTIGGTNFGGTTSVTFNGVAASSYSVDSASSITATVPAGATDGHISVTNPGGPASSPGIFYVIQAPSITSFTLTFGLPGATVAITGNHFAGTTAVKFGTTTASFSFVSDTQLTATVPVGAKTGPITVVNPAGTAVSSDPFVVSSTLVAPSNVTFTPANGPVGATVTINGQHFTGATEVDFNSTPATTYAVTSDTKITAKVPSGATSGPISVTNTVGTGTSVANFGVVVAPVITSFTPTSGSIGHVVEIDGSGFTGTTAVKFGATSASFSFVSDTELTAPVPTGAKTSQLSVTNAAGTATTAALSPPVFTVASTGPTVTGFSPAMGAAGAQVTITGTNLATTTDVEFGSVSASFVINSATSVTATVPTVPPVPGGTNVKITVTNDVGPATSTKTFTVIEPPVITSFSPGSGNVGTLVTITGSGFTDTGKSGGDFVEFNGTNATPFAVVSDSKITVKVPTAASTGTISVHNAAGTGTSVAQFVIPTGVATIGGFSPTTGDAGHTVVAITGTNLDGTTSVTFNGKKATIVGTPTAGEVDATVPTGATSGPIAVTTPFGPPVSTSPTTFTVDPLPKITGFSVSSGKVGDTVTILGSGFTVPENPNPTLVHDTVTFPGAAPVAVDATNDGHIAVAIPTGAQTGKVAVANQYGDSTTSSTAFVVIQAPSITLFSPTGGPVGTIVTITGQHFTGATEVDFDGTAATTFSVVNDGKITAKVPTGANTGKISVVNAADTAMSGTDFVVPTAAPSISGFSPTSGAAGGTSVTISGTGLNGVSSVTFGIKKATLVTHNTDTEIDVIVPAGSTTGPIAITTPGGPANTSSLTPSKFTVDPLPKITGFSVSSGKVGDTVTILGSGFTVPESPNPTLVHDTVTFPGAAPVAVDAADDGHIAVAIPTGAQTGKVAVANQYGQTATSTTSFTVYQVPAVTTFSPGSGAAGTTVTITGQHFTGATAVAFNGTSATTFTVVNDGKITAKVPGGATSGPITVTNAAGTGTSLASFIVPTGPPDISSLDPDNGPASSQAQTSVTINGHHLRGTTSVTFNGKPAASVSVIDDNTIVALTPAAGATTGLVKVTTPAGPATATFHVNPPPKITGLSAAIGVAGTTSVTITGSGFLGQKGIAAPATDVTVTFGTGSTAATAADDNDITVTVPATATTGKVTVANHWGETGTSTMVFTAIRPPHITTFSPGGGAVGTTVTINGSGFTGTGHLGSDFVDFNGTPATSFTVVNDGKITAKVPAGASTGQISVQNGAGTDTSAANFVVTTGVPTITSFTPSDGPASSQRQASLTITGTHLDGATSIKVGGKVQTLVSTDTTTEIDVTLAAGTPSGPIVVTTPSGSATTATPGGVGCGGLVGGPTTATCTGFTADPPPAITTVTPSGKVGDTITITGSGFFTKFNGAVLDNATTVSFNGVDAGDTACGGGACFLSVSSDTQILVQVPDAATTGPITVTNGNGESATTAGVFTVLRPPTISGFSPPSGAVGDPVTITGTHFSGTTEVDFDGVPATTFHVDSDTQITADVPTSATDGQLTVTTGNGSATSAGSFTVTP